MPRPRRVWTTACARFVGSTSIHLLLLPPSLRFRLPLPATLTFTQRNHGRSMRSIHTFRVGRLLLGHRSPVQVSPKGSGRNSLIQLERPSGARAVSAVVAADRVGIARKAYDPEVYAVCRALRPSASVEQPRER